MISGFESIDADFKSFQASLVAAVGKAMDDVGADMRYALAKHIETDVYDTYHPKTYERRGDAGGLAGQATAAKIYNHGGGVSLEYKPDGIHPRVEAWHKVDGDALIGRIEKHSPEYNWLPKKGKGIPNRPFWQNFVNDMVDGGELERFFVSAMQMADADLMIEDTGSVTRDENDGNY